MQQSGLKPLESVVRDMELVIAEHRNGLKETEALYDRSNANAVRRCIDTRIIEGGKPSSCWTDFGGWPADVDSRPS